MLNKLALALAVLIVVLLAAVAATTISASQDGAEEDPDSELTSSEEEVETPRSEVTFGAADAPLDIECQVPPDEESPLLVLFLNATNTTDDYVAQVTIVFSNGTTMTAVAEASSLRGGERRSVVPEPWPDGGLVIDCHLDAIQRGEQVILLDSNT